MTGRYARTSMDAGALIGAGRILAKSWLRSATRAHCDCICVRSGVNADRRRRVLDGRDRTAAGSASVARRSQGLNQNLAYAAACRVQTPKRVTTGLLRAILCALCVMCRA